MSGDGITRCSAEVGEEETVPVNICLTSAASAIELVKIPCVLLTMSQAQSGPGMHPYLQGFKHQCQREEQVSEVKWLGHRRTGDKDRVPLQVPQIQISWTIPWTKLPGLKIKSPDLP